MKKVLCVFLSFLMVFMLSACVEEDIPNKEAGQKTTSQSDEKTTFGLNDSAVFKDLKFTAKEMKESNGSDFFVPESGNVFVGVKLEIENISSEAQTVSSLLMFEAYADDVKCSYSFNAACAFDDGTLDGEIAPAKKLVGWYAVEIPENWKTLEIEVNPGLLSNNPATFVFEK